MQSLLTSVSMVNAKFCAMAVTVFNGVAALSEFMAPMPELASKMLALLELYAAFVLLVSYFLDGMTRFGFILNGPLMASLSEDWVVRIQKIVLTTLPGTLVAIEFIFLTSFDELSGYIVKHIENSESSGRYAFTLWVLIGLNICVMAALQIAIEHGSLINNKDNDGQCLNIAKHCFGLASNNGQDGGEEGIEESTFSKLDMSLKTARVVGLIGILMTSYVVYIQLGKMGQEATLVKWNNMISFGLLTVIIPGIVISKHDGMKSVAIKTLSFK